MAIFRLPLKILVLLMGETNLVDRPAWEDAWEVVEAEEERAARTQDRSSSFVITYPAAAPRR